MAYCQVILALAFILGYFGVVAGFMLGYVRVPADFREAFIALIGVVTATVVQITSYFFARMRANTTGAVQ
jgi:vacuolar-type H+-ATPase subunit I/STV1